MFKKLGPGILVAAAFIGPGTVATCTMAGVSFGYDLLWAMALSIVATIVLQEMAARLGVVSRKGLADVIRAEVSPPWIRSLVIALILGAIVLGNAAYEGGNIGGATLGLEALLGSEGLPYYPILIGLLAFVLLFLGNYQTLERTFVALVMLMSVSFLITAVLTRPDPVHIIKNILIPSLPPKSILTVVALVGTTVVPYNLFLHASLVSEKWEGPDALRKARWDTVISVILGGLVSIAIIISATAMQGGTVRNVMDLAKGLEPLYGNAARIGMGIGLFAAGVTSSITAPLAAAYVAKSCFGWSEGLKGPRFRAVWMGILVLGVLFMSFSIRPLEIITFAQVTNGFLLPLIAVFLLWATNRVTVMGQHRNTLLHNLLGVVILILAFILGGRSIGSVIGLF